MAARRLVVIMLVLLFVSSLAAALAPVRPGDRSTTSSSTTTRTERPEGASQPPGAGALVRAAIDADVKRPSTARATVGDQLQLRVDSRRVATVEIARLGATEPVAPLSPARFDVLLTRPGRYPLRFLDTRERFGTLVVRR
jgi:hypothetical protein